MVILCETQFQKPITFSVGKSACFQSIERQNNNDKMIINTFLDHSHITRRSRTNIFKFNDTHSQRYNNMMSKCI